MRNARFLVLLVVVALVLNLLAIAGLSLAMEMAKQANEVVWYWVFALGRLPFYAAIIGCLVLIAVGIIDWLSH